MTAPAKRGRPRLVAGESTDVEIRVRVPLAMRERLLELSEGTTLAEATRDALSLALGALEADAPDRPHAIARAADARARLAGLRRLRDEVDAEIAAAVSAMAEAERAAERASESR